MAHSPGSSTAAIPPPPGAGAAPGHAQAGEPPTHSPELLASVLSRINDGIVALDRSDRFTYVNPRAAQILQRSAAELLGQPLATAFPEVVGQTFYAAYQRAKTQGQPTRDEHFYPPHQRWFETRIYPDAQGITVYFTDITDRRQAELNHQQAQHLRRELSLLEHTLESILAGYWDIDFVANTAYMSPGLKRMFGYADHELPNHPNTWQTLIFAEDLPIALDCLRRHIESRGQVPYYSEVRYRHKDGSTVWVLCAGRVIDWDEAGQPRYMVGCHVDITQLKRSAAHLREAQRIGNLGSWELEVATERITWSDQLCSILGRSLGQPPADFEALQALIHPDDRDRHRRTIETLLASHQPYDDEFRFFHSDGSVRHLQIKGEAIVNAAGTATHLTGTALDISDRKHREAERQRLSLRLSLALQSARIGTWERVLATDEVIWDQRLIDFYGFERLGRNATYDDWRAQVHPEDIERVEAAQRAQLERSAPYDIEFRVWRGDGSLGWIRSSALVQRDADGQPLSIVGINYDITEQKAAAIALQRLSARLTLALESGRFGSWQWDITTDTIDWDQRLIDLYGLKQAVTTYAEWRACIHGDDVERVEAALDSTLTRDAPYDIEFRIYRPDGELRWIKTSALVYRDSGDRPVTMVGINYDITDRKRAEDLLRRTADQLAASNQELEAFAYSVSHDLRAPLRAIDGFSRALVEDYGDQFGEEGRDYFGRIRHNVDRMGHLIDDLLRLSRVSRQAIDYGPVNLSALVQEQLDELQAADPDRRVTTHIAPGLVVSADAALLRVAIANLVQNAWKFTAHRPQARIELGVTDGDGETIYALSDNGAGFDMAYAHKLFGVFQRLHNNDEFPGTGIGLATVQRVIHRHGGRVWAEGAVGQGATIYFTLPTTAALP